MNEKIAGVILLVLLSLGGGVAGGYYAANNSNITSSNGQKIVQNQQELISNIAKNVGPSVVSINVESDEVTDTFFGPQNITQESAGTGFIISRDGYVVTNRHVIPKNAKKVSVTLSNGDTLNDVKVIGRTASNDPLDVAVLKIENSNGNDLTPVDLGDSGDIRVGDSVVAIGNALGQLQNTVTSGIISGYGRDVTAGTQSDQENLANLLQTDAAINEGNSGGPLVNSNGEVVAINTAVAGNAQNIGFAIPINDVKGIIKTVLKTGEIKRPFLGIRYVSVNKDIADKYKLGVDNGAYLIKTDGGPAVLPGSPAEKAGLKQGDVVIKVNGKSIDDRNSLTSLIGQYSVGDEVELTIKRGKDTERLKVTLDEFK